MLNEKEDIVFVYKSINDLNEILVSNEKKSSYLIPLLMVKQNDYENTISITQESVKKSLKKPIVIDVSQKNGSEIKEKLEDHNKSKEIIIITQIENMNPTIAKTMMSVLFTNKLNAIIISEKESLMKEFKTYGFNSLLKFIKPYDLT